MKPGQTLGLTPRSDMEREQWAEIQQELRERRREFWSRAAGVAVGVFVGNLAAAVAFLVALDEGWFNWVLS